MIVAGQTIGNYRILSKIGTGGMGAVYLAEHPLIGKKVALKVVHSELASNRDVVQRFFQEARAANAIGNEHIVEIHDFGVTPEGDHFYIMEYLEGRTLAAVLSRETTMDPVRVLHVGAQIASALGAAHDAGVLHRDLKPDNIMLMSRLGDPDFVKVLDFGLAKMFASESSVQTAHGVLLGTPQYMSPEACESRRQIDHRTDIYALGILLFQMLTGKLPFTGDTMGEILIAQVRQLPPALRGLNPIVPPAVEQVVLRCLAKSPADRFQTMAELRAALVDPERYLRASPPISPARSVAPGESRLDAKQLAAHIEATHRARAASPNPAAGTGRNPVPGLAQPEPPKHNTMRIATPAGYISRPKKRIWPFALVLGVLLGLGAGATAVVLMRRSQRAAAARQVRTVAPPDAVRSAVVPMDARPPIDAPTDPGPGETSAIDGGGAVDAAPVATVGEERGLDAGLAHDAGVDAAAPATTVDAGVIREPIKVAITSHPAGAEVRIGGTTVCPRTPCEIQLDAAIGAELALELTKTGYEKKDTTVRAAANLSIDVPLTKKPGGSRRPRAGDDTGAGLMRPE